MMKKIVIVLMSVLFFANLQAQQYDSIDTIPGRYNKYYYTEWYDDCEAYRHDSVSMYKSTYGGNTNGLPNLKIAKECFTPQPLSVKGLVIMVEILDTRRYESLDAERDTEYMELYQYARSETDSLQIRDSVRWDTAAVKLMKLPLTIRADTSDDSTLFEYCYVYEAYFKSPVVVDSTFFIAGTFRSNEYAPPSPEYFIPPYNNLPTQLFSLRSYRVGLEQMCPIKYRRRLCDLGIGMGWFDETAEVLAPFDNYFGFFLPIVDQYNIEVQSADSTTGSVSGGGLIPDGWVDTLRAFPADGFEFTHWDDGNTDNPRIITVMGDSVFTAFFEPTDRTYTVTLDVNNPSWGSVEGAGSYPVYQQVEIRAVAANDTFAFVGWSDANWQNPRTITLTRDTSFTANFQRVLSVEESGTQATLFAEIRPNPASGSVRIDVKAEGRCRAEFIDAAGRVRYARSFDAPTADIDISLLQPGAWIVRITTPAGTTHRRLVVK